MSRENLVDPKSSRRRLLPGIIALGMSQIHREAERQLDALVRVHAGNRRETIIQLFLLALEREELVSVQYRDSAIVARLARMPVSEELRELIRRALMWAWKDEEMHALFSRGALLKLGNPWQRCQALACQSLGAVGGWAASILQQTTWRQAPLSCAMARVITGAGAVAGKLPRDVRDQLEFKPFREFCLFNAELEAVSKMSWERIVSVTEQSSEFSPAAVMDFRRVVRDEERHQQVFTILADALDSSDRLASGYTVDRLVERISDTADFYLPGSRRARLPVVNPIGSGGTVYCRAGRAAQEKSAVFRDLLHESGLREHLVARAGYLNKPIGEMSVAIKTAFMLGYHRADRSPITDPELVCELARFLKEAGCRDIAVVEAPNIYDRFFQGRSVLNVARYFGIESPHFRIVDAEADRVNHRYTRGMAVCSVARTWRDADFRISFGKMRSHPVDHALLALGNLEGLGARTDDYIFFDRQASRTTSLMMLADEFPPHFSLLDAYEAVPDGLVGMMGCTRPRHPLRVYAAADALALDMVAARHIGIQNPRDSGFLEAAFHWFGGWSEGVNVDGIDEPITDWRGPYSNELWAVMSFFALPMYMFASGRGLRFVPEMDPCAFPPVAPESWFLKFRRRNIRALLGLRLPQHTRNQA